MNNICISTTTVTDCPYTFTDTLAHHTVIYASKFSRNDLQLEKVIIDRHSLTTMCNLPLCWTRK